jgi:GDPmannose 4,6-dehydratase
MKAIIFGITGQDGSYLADLLLSKGYTVIGAARRTSTDGNPRLDHITSPNFYLQSCDITDAHSLRLLLMDHKDAGEIYNLAAQSHVGVSFDQPAFTWDATGKGCLNILETMRSLDIHKSARFYQASSSEMFGCNYDTRRVNSSYDFPREIKYQDEDTKFMPRSPYAIAKCAAHHYVDLYRSAYGAHASAGILFNHESPRRGENFVTRKITKWLGEYLRWYKNLPAKASMTWGTDDEYIKAEYGPQAIDVVRFPKLRLGNLDAYRDWGHAEDYVEAMWMMLQKNQGNDYVICTEETHSIREFLDVAFSRAGISDWESYVFIDPKYYRPAEVDYLKGCNYKARTVLKWEPKRSFETLVHDMVDHDCNDTL